ncbi:MAG: hypothetical protein WC449_01855 [Candidatus Paceibacterota bacterium]
MRNKTKNKNENEVLFETDIFDWQSFNLTESRVFDGSGIVLTMRYSPGQGLVEKLGGLVFGRAKLVDEKPCIGSLGYHVLESCSGYEGDCIRYFVLPKILPNVKVLFTESGKSDPNKVQITSDGTNYTLTIK